MSSPLRFALCGAFLLNAASVCSADVQSPVPVPEKPVAPLIAGPQEEAVPIIRVEAVTSRGEVRLHVEIHDGEIAKALAAIASKGHLQIIAKSGVSGALHELSLEDASPESALRKLCEGALLDYAVKDDVWVISPHKPPVDVANKPKLIADMAFENVEVGELLSMISEQFDIPIATQGNVEGKIAYIHLQNKTPRQALDIIALAADLKIEQVQDGTFIVPHHDAA